MAFLLGEEDKTKTLTYVRKRKDNENYLGNTQFS